MDDATLDWLADFYGDSELDPRPDSRMAPAEYTLPSIFARDRVLARLRVARRQAPTFDRFLRLLARR